MLCFCVLPAYQFILKLVSGAQEYKPEGPHCHGNMAQRTVQPCDYQSVSYINSNFSNNLQQLWYLDKSQQLATVTGVCISSLIASLLFYVIIVCSSKNKVLRDVLTVSGWKEQQSTKKQTTEINDIEQKNNTTACWRHSVHFNLQQQTDR